VCIPASGRAHPLRHADARDFTGGRVRPRPTPPAPAVCRAIKPLTAYERACFVPGLRCQVRGRRGILGSQVETCRVCRGLMKLHPRCLAITAEHQNTRADKRIKRQILHLRHSLPPILCRFIGTTRQCCRVVSITHRRQLGSWRIISLILSASAQSFS